MAEFHFVEDYEKYVHDLKQAHPLDEAMSLAVGGDYQRIGRILADVLAYAGLGSGMSVVDFGCGSGRAAKAISERFELDYLGFDIVQDLLDYAASVCPPHYRFQLNRTLDLAAPSNSADLVFAFSVFTHLLHEETYLYLEDIHRVLKADGILVFSFLEFHIPPHWAVFASTVEAQRNANRPHLNMFLERNQIATFARHLNYRVEEFIDGTRQISEHGVLGQSVAILRPGS